MTSAQLGPSDICQATVDTLTSAYGSKELSPVDAAQAMLARAELVQKQLNAFRLIDHEDALAAARLSESRWLDNKPLSPIDGVPITIKDIVITNGFDVRYGSSATPDISAFNDSPSVMRLRQAGAILLGLTNTPEFGWKAVTDSPSFGITRNPWDTSKTPGGSSGGAVAAAATGAGVLHLGTDGGGSIRIPASFTGLVGHKPSFGLVPAAPSSAFGTVAHIGPIARTVEDTAHMLNAMSGKDIRDWNQYPGHRPAISLEPIDWKGLRIGYWRKPCIGDNDPEVDAKVSQTVEALQAQGCVVEELSLPMQEDLLEIFNRHWQVGAANKLATISESLHSQIDPGFLEIAELGRRYSGVDRMQAEVARSEYGAEMDQLLENYDFLVSPTVSITAFEAGRNVPAQSDYQNWWEWSSYSYPINLSQQPVCTVPCGISKQGLPIGMQIVGGRTEDQKVLCAALSYQKLFPERFLTAGGNWPKIIDEIR